MNKKWYNMQQGWKPADDTLPARFFDQQLPDGASRGAVLDRNRLQEMITTYNITRGWKADGRVPEERLSEMKIVENPNFKIIRVEAEV